MSLSGTKQTCSMRWRNSGLKPRFRAGEPVTEQGNTVTDKKVVARLSLSSLGASASAGTGEPEIMAGRYQRLSHIPR